MKKISEFGTNVDLRFSKIKNKLLSLPHMEKCIEYGLYKIQHHFEISNKSYFFQGNDFHSLNAVEIV